MSMAFYALSTYIQWFIKQKCEVSIFKWDDLMTYIYMCICIKSPWKHWERDSWDKGWEKDFKLHFYLTALCNKICIMMFNLHHIKSHIYSPGWCGSVDWLSAGLRTERSLIQYVPGLQARSPVGGIERQPHIDVSLSFSLSLPLSKNK